MRSSPKTNPYRAGALGSPWSWAKIAMCQTMADEAGDKLTGLACHGVKPDSEAFPVH